MLPFKHENAVHKTHWIVMKDFSKNQGMTRFYIKFITLQTSLHKTTQELLHSPPQFQ
jgi:hypothetical protein